MEMTRLAMQEDGSSVRSHGAAFSPKPREPLDGVDALLSCKKLMRVQQAIDMGCLGESRCKICKMILNRSMDRAKK